MQKDKAPPQGQEDADERYEQALINAVVRFGKRKKQAAQNGAMLPAVIAAAQLRAEEMKAALEEGSK